MNLFNLLQKQYYKQNVVSKINIITLPKQMHQGQSNIIPDQFTAKQKLLHMKMHMKLKDKHGKTFGTISQKLLSVGITFQFHDEHDHLIAVGHKKVFSLGTHLQIHDGNSNKIGGLSHQILKSMASIHDKFSVQDANGHKVGTTQQIDILKTVIHLKDRDGHKIGDMKKSFINLLGDKWDCTLYGDIDRRLLIFIPAFVSVIQAERKKQIK